MSDRVESSERIKNAYDQLDYELVEINDNFSVPTSSPARFDYEDMPGVTNADIIADRFEESELAFIDVLAQNGEDWHEFSVSGKAYDDETNEFCRISVSTAGVTVFKKDEELSFETFEKALNVITNAMETELVFEAEP